MTYKIRFLVRKEDGTSQELSDSAESGEKLTAVAHRVGVEIKQTCGGKATCVDCRVLVREGVWDAFNPIGPEEKISMGTVYHITKERLACQAEIRGNAVVEIPFRDNSKK